ncbi:MAG: LysM peptidoglycan-binding domain-containing protein [Methylococcaceae bacterium]|nr:LysM peptidoglycan-binding domain-containing protein [Methylococcaceae bacterium]
MTSRILIALLWLAAAGLATAEEIELNPNHPESYTVVKGDTLWDISGRFLAHPWQWPQIWHENPQIANPHWIYPGDVLTLTYVNGKPRLTVGRPSEVRLSPQIRINPEDQAVPTIPVNAIQQFLSKPKVVEAGEMEASPYIVAFPDDRIVAGAGDRAYIRGLPNSKAVGLMVYRTGPALKDGETGEVLGYEALYVAAADYLRPGDPATVALTQSQREVLIGDRLLPIEEEKVTMHYVPHPPKTEVHGHIIGMVDGVTQIGQYQIVVIDRGLADGIDEGTVLDVNQSGCTRAVMGDSNCMIRDRVSSKPDEKVSLPEEKAGSLLIFKPYQRISYGLVMEATRPLHVLDSAQTP